MKEDVIRTLVGLFNNNDGPLISTVDMKPKKTPKIEKNPKKL
jgi:hypothetical protein